MTDTPIADTAAEAPLKRKGVKRRAFLIGGVAIVGLGDVADAKACEALANVLSHGGHVVDDKDPRGHLEGLRGAGDGAAAPVGDAPRGEVSCLTVLMKGIIWMGFDIYASHPASRTCCSS